MSTSQPLQPLSDAPRSAAATPRPTGRVVQLTTTRKRYGESVVKGLLVAATLLSVLTTVGLVVSLLGPAIQFFRTVGLWRFISEREWAPLFEPAQYGVRSLVVATLLITGIALLVCIPLGLGAAIYLSEYAPRRLRKISKPILEILAGIPTVVYGFFALTFVTPNILQKLPLLGGSTEVNIYNALSAGLVMGVMIIPTVASLSEDAMAAVPDALRQGSLGLGANKFQTTVKVVLPASLSGVIASCILAATRAIGETMVVTIAAGAIANLSGDPRDSMQTITSFIAQVAQGDLPTGSNEYRTMFALGLTLFLATLLLNMLSNRLVRRFREVYE